MKKTLLSILAVAAISASAQTVTIDAADLKLTPGNEWYMVVTPGVSVDDFTKTGTNVSWDLTSYESALTKDTLKAANATFGIGSTVSVSSNIVSETNYQVTGSDVLMTGTQIDATQYSFNTAASTGFAHNINTTTWSSPTSFESILGTVPATIGGSVLAEGTVTTSYGSFDAVLIEETFVIPTLVDEKFYYWETEEYGRIAVISGSNFLVMEQNNFNQIVSTQEAAINALNIFPNPSTDNFTIKADGLENVQVFDAIGNLVVNETVSGSSYLVNTAQFNAGVYFVQATINGGVTTSRVVVK